jgi:hypothetical protein
MYILERESILEQNGQGHLPCSPAGCCSSLGSQVLEDSQSHWRLTVAIGNKQLQQINKQYTKHYLKSNQTVPKYSTRCYEHVSIRIT